MDIIGVLLICKGVPQFRGSGRKGVIRELKLVLPPLALHISIDLSEGKRELI